MKRSSYFLILVILLVFALHSAPLPAATGEDSCSKEGIIVKNLTMLDRWYTKNGGACTIWINNHVLRISPEDRIVIFSDMVCETLYCTTNPEYKDYKSFDTNGNCGVRILPNCILSDM